MSLFGLHPDQTVDLSDKRRYGVTNYRRVSRVQRMADSIQPGMGHLRRSTSRRCHLCVAHKRARRRIRLEQQHRALHCLHHRLKLIVRGSALRIAE